MNRLFSVIALFSTALLLAGCRIASIDEEFSEESDSSVKFTLKATYGNPDSKVSLNEDGLNMSWTEGDVLYLIDTSGKRETVTLTSDITKPSKTATFYTKNVVPAGEYIVLYGQNSLEVLTDIHMKPLSDSDSMAELAQQVRLYGSLTVMQDQTSAEITLKQLYAMLTFKFQNIPTGGVLKSMGMAVASEGLKNLYMGEITKRGLQTEYSGTYMISFAWGLGMDSKSLIAPVDLSGKKVFFYVWGENAEGRHINYEFAKDGIDLKEGNNYNITLDFSKATVSTIYTTKENARILTSPADFRAAAYWNSGLTFWIENDIDFKDEVVFPIRAAGLWGNGHTLSNINIDLALCRQVGLLSEGHGHDINIVSSSVTGYDRVGSICGYGYCENCSCNSVTVNGGQDVGGLVGRADYDIKNSSLLGESQVYGSRNFVGGIVGYGGLNSVDSCLVNGTILIKGEGEYTGGIAGRVDEMISVCGVRATVTGARYYTGGVTGEGNCSQSYCYGDVVGTEYVGGVIGIGNCTNCYHIGSVTGAHKSLVTIGGISGNFGECEISNCYSCGTVSSGYGICYQLSEECAGTNLTSESRLSSNVEAAENSSCSPEKSFLSKISVLQSNGGSYVEACWPSLNIGGGDPRCPLLSWQYEFDSSIVIPGFNDMVW